jgi:formylglycine-generating enzyme required for sulfatase activity
MRLSKHVLAGILLFIAISAGAQKKIKMVLVEGGTFEMGSDNKNFKDETPKHKVRVDSFYISQFEISFDDYMVFCNQAGYSEPYGTYDYPVTNITWQRAVMMCNWLSRRDGFDRAYDIQRDDKETYFKVTCNFKSNGYRLPTEAEWEYATRGGHRSKNYKFSGSNSPFSVAWYSDTYQGMEHKSGELLPNELGLYDMTGNVAEWCWDRYDESYYSKKDSINPKGPDVGSYRVFRGGSRRDKMIHIENTRRFYLEENKKDMYLGFRVVRSKVE